MNFKSDYFYNNVYDIDYDILKKNGIYALLFDIDNTLAEYDSPYPDDKLIDLFNKLISDGFKIYFLSNNNRMRVKTFAERTGFPYKARALKPLGIYIKKAMRQLGVNNDNTALIGDQLFTDVLGANRANITSILVKPLSDKEDKFVAFKRHLEKFVNRGK